MRLVAYYRVSTKRQGQSGLGLAAQKRAVEQYAKSIKARIVTSFREVESGKRADRPKLAEAIQVAKSQQATLVVAKLDRLARNVAFLSAMMQSDVDFVACDNPHANKLTIHVLAAVAEDELDRISARIKAAMNELRKKGVKLGRVENFSAEASRRNGRKAAAVTRRKALEWRVQIVPILQELRDQGLTLEAIAKEMNRRGHTTRTGKLWTGNNIENVLAIKRRARPVEVINGPSKVKAQKPQATSRRVARSA